MHAFHLLVGPSETSELQRVDFEAVGPEHAFQIARNESEAAHIELWEGELLLARMSRLDANVWKLLPLIPDTAVGQICRPTDDSRSCH